MFVKQLRSLRYVGMHLADNNWLENGTLYLDVRICGDDMWYLGVWPG